MLSTAPRAAQNIVQQRLRCRRWLAVGIDKYSQGIVPRQERFTLGFVDFVDPCTANFADFANPTHDLDLIVIASRTNILDLMAHLENHPVSATQLIERMTSQAYRVVISLLDPVEKDRVVRPSEGIELVALHPTPVTIAVAVLHRVRLITANSQVLLFATRSKGDFDFLRQTNRTPAFRVYVYP